MINQRTFGLATGASFLVVGLLNWHAVLMALGFGILIGVFFGAEPDWKEWTARWFR